MSNSMLVSITIGAVLSTAFKDAIGGAEKTLTRLGGVAGKLTERHEKMGRVMAGALKRGMDVDKLKGRYDAFGRAIERVSGSQKKLNDLMKAGVDLKNARASMRGDMMDAVGTAVAIGAPVLSSVRGAGNFEDQMKDISITGGFSRQEESALGATVRADAVKFNQTQEELARGMSVLVAGGIQSAKELSAFSPILGKAATATRAGVDDLGRVFLALRDNMQITAKDSESSLNILAYAGKQGAVEIRDMAKFLPQLAPMMAALGSTGKEGVAEIGAALQIARRGAGTNDEAANNFKNFLAKITSPDTIKDFAKAGIDLKARLVELRKDGLSPMEGSLRLITEYMGKQGPAAARDFQAAMKSKDGAEMEAAVAKLGEAYKLGELFQDMQAMSFIKPAVAHGADMAEMKKGALAAGSDDLIGKDFAKRMEGFNEQWKALTIQARELGIAVGTALLPPLTSLIQSITPFVTTMGALVQRFPRLTAAVIGLTTGAVLGRVAWITFAYGMNLWKAAALGVQTASARVGAKLALMQARTLLASGAIRIMNLSLLASPVGWIALAIGAAALLIYKYWKPISGFFRGLWTGIKEGLKGLEPAWAVFKKALPFILPIIIPLKKVWAELRMIWGWLKNLLKPVEDVGGAAENMGLRFGRVIGDILKSVIGLAAKMINAGANVKDDQCRGQCDDQPVAGDEIHGP